MTAPVLPLKRIAPVPAATRRVDLAALDFDNCPVRDMLSQIGGKWSALLIDALSQRPIDSGSCGGRSLIFPSAC